MAEVPRIVRERLRSQMATGEHPDANLLSAFSERRLSEQERAQVLDHLSRCAECREVVALTALPQVEEERLVAAGAVASGRSWWRSPVVHWSALTAAALVVMIAVGERMRLRQGHSASAPAIATVSSNEAGQKSAAQGAQVSAPANGRKQPARIAKIPTTRQPTETLSRAETAEAGSAGKAAAMGGGSAGVAAKNVPRSHLPLAAVPMKPHPSAEAGKIEAPPPEKERKVDQFRAQAVPSPSVAAGQADVVVGTAAAGTAAAAAPKSEATILVQRPGANFTRRAFLGPRWSVSDSGALQRSFDGGRSWKEVIVAEGVTFRAVAVVVTDVWAGGSGGALYHSADGGENWARVRMQVNGRTPSGDIVRIEFTDAQNGVVATSTGETWTTSDAGATWRWQ
ncbi:MAG: YCF48-related protein [Terriglobales bacterium]